MKISRVIARLKEVASTEYERFKAHPAAAVPRRDRAAQDAEAQVLRYLPGMPQGVEWYTIKGSSFCHWEKLPDHLVEKGWKRKTGNMGDIYSRGKYKFTLIYKPDENGYVVAPISAELQR